MEKRHGRGIALLTAGIMGLVLLGSLKGLFQVSEWRTFDWLKRISPKEKSDSRIVVVAVNESDIQKLGKWTISDRDLARLLRHIKEQQPVAIGLDIYRDLPVEPGYQELVEVFNTTPNLFGISKIGGTSVSPPPALEAKGNVAASDLVLDIDGRIRRSLVFIGDREGLGTKLGMYYLQKQGVELQEHDPSRQAYRLGQAIFTPLTSNDGEYTNSDTGGYQILLNYRGEATDFTTISLIDVLENRIPKNLMRDRIVLIGAFAPSLNDVYYTPYVPNLMPGVIIHANIASQTVSAALDGRPLLQASSKQLNWLWFSLWAIAGAYCGSIFRRYWYLAIIYLIVAMTILGVSAYLALIWGWWIPLVTPAVSLVSVAIAVTVWVQAQYLRWSYIQLEDYAQNLEQKVNERTAALQAEILERQKAEQQAEFAKEAANAANRAKSEFLANMSHELRTPLNGILGYAQILQQSMNLAEHDLRCVSTIYDCGSHLLTLINDVLDISKIEARNLELAPFEVNFMNLLRGIVDICQIRAEQKLMVTLVCDFDHNLPKHIYVDEKRLRQVLLNLVSNAVKFTDKGQVIFKVSLLSDLDQHVKNIRFQVEDTGIGIDPEQLEKIFLPFEQVSDRRRNEEGTGLGLAISQRIAQVMGGMIKVTSVPNQGSVFWLDLLLTVVESGIDLNLPSGVAIAGFHGKKRRILIIDDRWENLSVIINLLEPLGFELVTAENGKIGLEQAIALDFDLIITDLVMPVMDGFSLIHAIRQTPEIENIVIIVSSASVFIADQNRSLQAGADDFLPKPVQRDILLYLLQKHLNLEWIYQELEPETTILNTPTLDELERLAKLAAKGNLSQIIREVHKLESEDENVTLFCQKINDLANDYEVSEIVKLLNQSIKTRSQDISRIC
jgi:CHASE2 domain-containing sensor protein/CheY-like chemotaxis protein